MISFVPGLTHASVGAISRWLLVVGDQILVVNDQFLLSESTVKSLLLAAAYRELKVGQISLDGQLCDCFCCYIDTQEMFEGLTPTHQFYGLRSFLLRENEAAFQLLGAAVQLGAWLKDHQYCGRCARQLIMRTDDRAMYCEPCNHRYYPRVSPCVIMLVTCGARCLLAVHRRSALPIHTALAGFVEAGETLEQAVVREVAEEVGLKVSHSEYIGSQPWPFPGQLMMGFLAEVPNTETAYVLQDDELTEAAWHRFDQLPELIPPLQTLSGRLIRTFVERYQKPES